MAINQNQNNQNINPLQPDFEQIKKTAEDGKEYWSARELAQVFGYSTRQKFNRVFNKALQVAQNRGLDMSEHFNQTVEMVRLGSGSFREVDNWHLLMGRYMRRESLKKKQLLENFQ